MVDVTGKTIFISGPMSGVRNYNVAAFCDAHATLKRLGAAHVFNPALGYLSPPAHMLGNEPTHEEWMLAALAELTKRDFESLRRPFYDLLVSLDGYGESVGALLERQVARACGIEVVEMRDVEADE